MGIVTTDGVSESNWSRFAPLHAAPECSLVDVLPTDSRLVVVSPHPDDETLMAGGLLHLAACAGNEALVLSVTDGEASHPGSQRWSPALLRRARARELNRALKKLGGDRIRHVRFQFPDGEVGRWLSELRERIGASIVATDVVVTPWRVDGHPDHEAVTEAVLLLAASSRTKVLQAPIWSWHWEKPTSSTLPWDRVFRLPLPKSSGNAKRDALSTFRSQLNADSTLDTPPVLRPSMIAHFLRDFETFVRPE